MWEPGIVPSMWLINHRRACAARVTVLGESVCLSVCLSVCHREIWQHREQGGRAPTPTPGKSTKPTDCKLIKALPI